MTYTNNIPSSAETVAELVTAIETDMGRVVTVLKSASRYLKQKIVCMHAMPGNVLIITDQRNALALSMSMSESWRILVRIDAMPWQEVQSIMKRLGHDPESVQDPRGTFLGRFEARYDYKYDNYARSRNGLRKFTYLLYRDSRGMLQCYGQIGKKILKHQVDKIALHCNIDLPVEIWEELVAEAVLRKI